MPEPARQVDDSQISFEKPLRNGSVLLFLRELEFGNCVTALWTGFFLRRDLGAVLHLRGLSAVAVLDSGTLPEVPTDGA